MPTFCESVLNYCNNRLVTRDEKHLSDFQVHFLNFEYRNFIQAAQSGTTKEEFGNYFDLCLKSNPNSKERIFYQDWKVAFQNF